LHATVYTETVVFSPPERYAADAPYQLAIVEHADGTRQTVRISGERVQIGDAVVAAQSVAGVPYFRKAS
jgi:uncharacterized OB-fold protein